MATKKGAALQTAAEREADLQDQLILQFESDLEAVLRKLDRELDRLVRLLPTDKGRLVRTQFAIARALRIRSDIVQAMNRAGFRELAQEATDDRFDHLTTLIEKRANIGTVLASPTGVETVLALKELRLADLLDWSDTVAQTAWRITVDGVLGLRPVDELVSDLADAIDLSAPRARSVYDTAVSTFSRQVSLLESRGTPDELFLYAGPVDSVTRKFCLDRVGKVFSRTEIEQMDNGQLPDVLVTCGGYNCRHTCMPVSVLDTELINLHKTGGRLPHIQAQVDALRKKAA